MKWWELPLKEIYKKLKTDPQKGLRESEIKKRLKKHGANLLPQKSKTSIWSILFRQFASVLIVLLFVAAIVAAILGEIIDAVAILSIVILNAILGFIQEYKAEKSLEALQKLTVPLAKVLRGGAIQEVSSEEIVPGDILLLEQGDHVSADGRVVESSRLAINEAALTGESLPSQKNADVIEKKEVPIGDRFNMVFMGTAVVSGKAKVLITETGKSAELGKIASYLQTQKKEKTPLQKRLKKLGHLLIYICLGIIAVIFTVGLLRGYALIDMVLIALSLAVAAVPEGLPAIVTVALAIGVRSMAKRQALIRRLSSVETLGCATVICSDKTGTLTQNKMIVRKVWAGNKEFEVTGEGYEPKGEFSLDGKEIHLDDHPELFMSLKIATLCNNAYLEKKKKKHRIIGDPTEGALLVAAEKASLTKEDAEKKYPIIEELPFDSERKMMSVLRKWDTEEALFVKGAPDILIEKSKELYLDKKIETLSSQSKESLLSINEELANQGMRVIGVAYKKNRFNSPISYEDETDLIFVGLFAMRDPPRKEVKKSIDLCQSAGIHTVMVTGDHKVTATSIAKELNLMEEGSVAISGSELEEMDDKELNKKINQISVFARISAEHKLRLIKSLKKNDHVVAMTGDGVNDSLAVKEADIGISMGITGTDVTKEASDMVILDDNFASIQNAVKEGRGIYDNIQKFIGYLLSANFAEILIIFLAMLLSFKDLRGNAFVILAPIQILWLNLITDGFPAMAMGVDPVDKNVMERPPRNPRESIIPLSYFIELIILSSFATIGTLIAAYFGMQNSPELAQTMAFTTLVILELVIAQVIRSLYYAGLFSNYWFLLSIIGSFVIHLLILYIPPFQTVFKTVPLSINDWIIIGSITIAVALISSLFVYIIHKKKATP
jgi:Ca2+-transporting ATPase